jgi:hypothetical protein
MFHPCDVVQGMGNVNVEIRATRRRYRKQRSPQAQQASLSAHATAVETARTDLAQARFQSVDLSQSMLPINAVCVIEQLDMWMTDVALQV